MGYLFDKEHSEEARENRALVQKIVQKHVGHYNTYKIDDDVVVVQDSRVVEDHIKHCLHNYKKQSYIRTIEEIHITLFPCRRAVH